MMMNFLCIFFLLESAMRLILAAGSLAEAVDFANTGAEIRSTYVPCDLKCQLEIFRQSIKSSSHKYQQFSSEYRAHSVENERTVEYYRANFDFRKISKPKSLIPTKKYLFDNFIKEDNNIKPYLIVYENVNILNVDNIAIIPSYQFHPTLKNNALNSEYIQDIGIYTIDETTLEAKFDTSRFVRESLYNEVPELYNSDNELMQEEETTRRMLEIFLPRANVHLSSGNWYDNRKDVNRFKEVPLNPSFKEVSFREKSYTRHNHPSIYNIEDDLAHPRKNLRGEIIGNDNYPLILGPHDAMNNVPNRALYHFKNDKFRTQNPIRDALLFKFPLRPYRMKSVPRFRVKNALVPRMRNLNDYSHKYIADMLGPVDVPAA